MNSPYRPVLIAFALLVEFLYATMTRPSHAAGVEPTKISLPKGPGSIEGLGRNFVPSLSSGTASFGIDIAVPPGAGGFSPSLSLEYDSGGGVSELGMGFRLSGVPSVRRRADQGLPRFDDTDAFELSGIGMPSNLLEMSDGTFRPQYETGAFARGRRSDDDQTWEARVKSGVTFRFGGDGYTEQEDGNVATYLLREQADLHGHFIRYEWDTSEGHALLTRVIWNDFSSAARQEIALEYEPRPDVHELFSSGIRKVLSRRLRSIAVSVGGNLLRRYVLGYSDAQHSLLESVTLYGSDDETALPSLSLAYTEPSFAVGDQLVRIANAPGRSPADKDVALADLNGDSLPDVLVTQAGRYQSHVNHDGTSFSAADSWSAADSPSFALSSVGAQLADLDGDGAIDLVTKSGTNVFRFFPGKEATRFAAPVSIATVPNFTFEDPDVRLADMDGDRRSDVVITTAAGIAIGYNLGGRDWMLPETVGPIDASQTLRFSDGLTEFCDINGDRVQDLCVLRSGALTYWLGRGRGRFESARQARSVPPFDASDRFRLVDLDGDGWVDLVRVGVSAIQYALASRAGEFGDLQTIEDVPERTAATHFEFADMNGSGTTDIVWINLADEPENAWTYLELFPDGRAGLLHTIENGLGKVTRIHYEPAAASAARARDAGSPWTTRMNVAMPVVARVEVDSSIGDSVIVTEYSYRDGTWDPEERTFAAFASGTETHTGDDHTPALITETTFDTGLRSRVLRGSPRSVELRDETGAVFSRTTSDYSTMSLARAMDGRSVEYGYKSGERVEHIEGRSRAETRTTLTEWLQDGYGNTIEERRWGEIAGNDFLIGNDESFTIRTFATNLDDWILGYPATEEITDAAGQRMAMKRVYYDGEAFEGLELGTIRRGDLSRVEEWVGPKSTQFQIVSTSRYDQHGNPLEVRDGRGGSRTYEWDRISATRVVAETVDTGSRRLEQKATYDATLGTVETFTDFNGAVTAYVHEPLGRVTHVIRPGDSHELPTIRYSYELDAPLSRLLREYRLQSGEPNVATSIELIDGLGRKRATVAEDEGGRWVLGDVALLDARGQVYRTLYPRHVGSAKIGPEDLLTDGAGNSSVRDAIARVIRTETELGLVTRTEFAPFETRYWDAAQTTDEFGYEQTPVTETSDGLGRLLRVSWILGGKPVEKTFAYDAAGRITERRDAEGNVTLFHFDGRGRLTGVDDPDSGKHHFVLDTEGELLERHHPDGAITSYTYDLLGRPLTEDWDGDGNPEVEREYDRGGALYFGLLSQVSEPSGSTSFEYDERQRIISVTRVIDGETYENRSGYDAQDRKTLHGYPDGSSIELRRNKRGFISGFGDDLIRIYYEADGREVRREYANGLVEEFGFDDDRRVRQHRVTAAENRVVQHLHWTLDGAGNITGIEDRREGISPDRDLSARYRLDNLYRLTRASGTWGQTEWSYSPNGNITARTSTVPSEHGGDLTYGRNAGPNALTGISGRTIRYDARGRMVHDGERSYHWNGIDRLERVDGPDSASVESTFDAQAERRVRRERDASGREHTTHFVDAWSEVKDGELIRYVVHRDQRIVRLAATRVDNAGASAGARRTRTAGHSDEAAALSSARPPSLSLRLARLCSQPGAVLALAFLMVLGIFVARASAVRALLGRAAWVGLALALFSCGGSDKASPRSQGPMAAGVRTLTAHDQVLLYDHLGALTQTVGARDELPVSTAFYPYGTERFDTGVGETHRFASTPRDVAVGVDLMGARAYVPSLGVWASPDPALLDDPAEHLSSHPSHSPYAYANSNPVSLRDEEGEFALPVLLAAAVFIGVTFTAKKLEEPHSTAELAADMARLSAQAYGTLSGVRAAVTAVGAGLTAATRFVAQAAGATATAAATTAVKEKVVQKATEVDPTLGKAVDLAVEVAPAIVSKAPRKVSAAPKTRVLRSEKDFQKQYGELGASTGARPPNMSPPDAGRRGAFREAKRQSGVPVSQQPSRVLPNTDRRGARQPGRLYEFDQGPGKDPARIRDDAGGHDFGPGDPQNRGPHFNDQAGNHYDY